MAKSSPEKGFDNTTLGNRELSILNDIAQALNREVDLDRALLTTLARVADLLDLQTGWIWLLHEETGDSYLAAAQNLPPALANYPQRMEGTCYCLDTYRAGDLEGAANINVITCSRLRWLIDGTLGLKYHASIPLYAHGKRLGVLNVASTDWRENSTQELAILYTIGDMLSIAVERARLFARSIQMGAVEERNRLAREIHDTLAQGLAGIALQLETADALLDGEEKRERAQEAVKLALELAKQNLEEARRSVLDLRAAPLLDRSLAQALQSLGDEYAAREGWSINLNKTEASRPLPVRIETGLYRVAQEALSNIARHASARKVNLQLTLSPDWVRLFIEDDGSGFDPDHIPEGRFGLVGLNERVRLMNGRMRMESSRGVGTRIEVEIPLERDRKGIRTRPGIGE